MELVKKGVLTMGVSGSLNGGTVPCKATFRVYIPLHSPYIGLIYGKYLQFRIRKSPLILLLLVVNKPFTKPIHLIIHPYYDH